MNYFGYIKGFMPVISRVKNFDNLTSSQLQDAKEQLNTEILTTNEEIAKREKEYPKIKKEIYKDSPREILIGEIIDCTFYDEEKPKGLNATIGIPEDQKKLYEKIKSEGISTLNFKKLESDEAFINFNKLIIYSVGKNKS